MSTETPQITIGMRMRWTLTDGLVIMRRNLLKFVRIPALFVFSIVQPIMFVLLFRYVFNGLSGLLPPSVSYVNFLIPGIFVQTAIFGSTQTGIGLSEDLSSGIIDRFRSLPMARSGVLVGRTLSDFMRNLVVVLLMTGVGYLVGFSFQAGLPAAIIAILLAVLVGYAFSWVSALIGLAIKDSESVQAASFTWIFPLTFISSALVPLQSMTPWLQVVARNNPVTVWSNAVRVLTIGTVRYPDGTAFMPPAGESLVGLVVKSFLWIALILIVFVPLAVRQYRKLT
jgi:ABC transporter DrrB family efflux protein